MKLYKKLKVQVVQVLADYKVKVKNAPFLAILQLAAEQTYITPDELKQQLLHPLSIPACRNILRRLVGMGYFDTMYFDSDTYEISEEEDSLLIENFLLSELGQQAVERKEYYESRRGILEIYIAEENEFIPERIVKIKEVPNEWIEEEKFKYLTKEIAYLADGSIIPLRPESFIIDKIESKYLPKGTKKMNLCLDADQQSLRIKIEDYERIERGVPDKRLREEILSNEFNSNYLKEYDAVKYKFNKNNLQLKRNLEIEKPQFRSTFFDNTSISNVNILPKTKQEAYDWHRELIKSRIT